MGIDALEVKWLLEGWWQAEGRPYFADREVVAQIMYGVQKQIAAAVIDFAQGFDGGQRSMLVIGMCINIGGRCHDNIWLERFYQIAKVVHQTGPSRAGLEVFRQWGGIGTAENVDVGRIDFGRFNLFFRILAHGGQCTVEVAQLQDIFRRHAGQKGNGQAVPNAHSAFLQILCLSIAVACAVKIAIVEAAAFAGG